MQTEQVRAHLHHEQGDRQDGADDEPVGEVGDLGIGAGAGRGVFRLQRHAAFWTGSRADLAHLGVHGAGVDDAGLDGFGRGGRQVFRRISDELRSATGRAEVELVPVVRRMVGRLRRIDRHAADGILRCGVGRGLGVGALGMTVIVRAMVMRHGRSSTLTMDRNYTPIGYFANG